MIKKIFGALILISALVFIGQKVYHYPEQQGIKRVNELYYSRQFEKAKGALGEHLKKYPGSSQGWSYLGLVKLELNDTAGAEAAYRNGLELDKESDKAMVGLGIIARQKGNYSEARRYYEQARAVKPNNPDIYASLMVLELKDKNYAKAVKLGEKSKDMDMMKRKPGILANLVLAYHLNGELEKRDLALAELRKMNYPDIRYTAMIINDQIDIDDFL